MKDRGLKEDVMSEQPVQLPLPGFDQARAEWRQAYAERMGAEKTIRNR